MKNKSLLILVLLAVLATSFTSCASTKTEEEPNPYFLADMDAFEIGTVVALNKQNFFKPKPINITVDFFPRTSSIGLGFKDALNKVYIIYSPEEFKALCDSIGKYQELSATDSFQENYKPGRKNNFYKGRCHILWGIAGLGREVDTPFETNYEWLEVNNEKNPYFRLFLPPTNYPQEEHVASPTVSVYFTPSQAKTLAEIVNMDSIMKEINDFNSAAYDFE